MVSLQQIRDLVITPALKAVDLYSDEARDLMLYTGLVESGYRYVAQLGDGPARSFWQVEPKTALDHFDHYLRYRDRHRLEAKVKDLAVYQGSVDIAFAKVFPEPLIDELTFNMRFAVVMARLVYRRSPDPLPALGDGPGMAAYWKRIYNTPAGKGTEEEFIRLWEKEKI